ncbi:MAG: DUF4037 domain-containing protein [Clostridia bacterium]|nr:DUF4037 domain-containing protein [Clostridia bacterium]
MKGLELSREYYLKFGKPMLEERFPDIISLCAIGLVGAGSECLGYDDEVSRDHDFEPGFSIFLPGEDEVDRRRAFELERAYAALPGEFGGVKRQKIAPVGGNRHGVIRLGEFLEEKIGCPDGKPNEKSWLSLPDQALIEVTGGELFSDPSGNFSRIREELSFFPEDVFLKKLAGHLLLMAQSGQYNYSRCLSHGEPAAAQLAVAEFSKSAASAVFLLNGKYQPYYKWTFRALRELPVLPFTADLLEYLLTTPNDENTAEEKYGVIEGICSDVAGVLIERSLTKAVCGDLEKHAYSVNDMIKSPFIRNLSVLAAV